MTWYRVSAGAFRARPGADALLASLRRRQYLAPDGGTTVSAPLSILLAESGLAQPDAERVIAELRARGYAPFALRQEDGRMRVYIGAFERAEQASALLAELRGAQVRAALAYRVGRAP
jgi:cell division septation protein DedD